MEIEKEKVLKKLAFTKEEENKDGGNDSGI